MKMPPAIATQSRRKPPPSDLAQRSTFDGRTHADRQLPPAAAHA